MQPLEKMVLCEKSENLQKSHFYDLRFTLSDFISWVFKHF